MKRLALGTAQFGLPYGYGNQTGQVDLNTAGVILQEAMKAGLNTLDTAVIYGSSEKNLGMLGVNGWKVISKVPAVPEYVTNTADWIEYCVTYSLDRLKIEKLYGLLLHRPRQLLGNRGYEIYEALSYIKSKGWVEKTGLSIYGPEELDDIWHLFKFDLIQTPFNVIDQRLLHTGWLSLLKQDAVEIHARSVFLQGLLLCNTTRLPDQFNRWHSLWEDWHNWLDEVELTPLKACLRFVLSHKEIDRAIIGVNNLSQLEEVLLAAKGDIPPICSKIICNDPDLINPRRWQIT